MGNNYKQFGPFIYGDPRFLAGGSRGATLSYSDDRLQLNDGVVVCPPDSPKDSAYRTMSGLGQSISIGKSGYHGNPKTNLFVGTEDLKYPTVGVEVETILRNCSADSAQMFTKSLYSNWFHAENDGSLDRAHGGTYGYELVTTVLPARLYRDINVWTGFQNLVSPLLYSYSSNETGLHVHVGMGWFENTNLPGASLETIMLIGKILTSQIYYSYLPRSLAQRVFLRNSDLHYCHETNNWRMAKPLNTMTGRQLLDEVMEFLLSTTGDMVESSWVSQVHKAIMRSNHTGILQAIGSGSYRDCAQSNGLTYGHDSELNASPRLTLEFRRGKGTTNALSIHRMIELCALTVMYAGHVIDNPNEIVSSEKYMSYLIENTTSQALKVLAEKEMQKCA